ncbi:hypothetical protein F7725_026854, partial [Dissostichus mawsoni]
MLFGEEVSGKFLAKWPTFFKPRIIADCKNLPGSLHVDELLLSARQESDDGGNMDCEVAAILLLLHLLPPTSKGKKSRVKISAKDATGRLVKFLRFQHGLYPGRSLRLHCGELGCSFVFCTYSGYKRHLSRAHEQSVDPDVTSHVEFEPGASVGASVSQPFNVDSPVTVTTNIPMEKRKILDMCSSVIAQVQASGVPESTVQCLVGSMEELVKDIHAHAKEAVVE